MLDPIVFLPGLLSGASSWSLQLPVFGKDRVVTVPNGYYDMTSIEEMADCILEQCPERFHFVAWSMGGYVALHLAPKLKDRLLSLVLVSTSARPENPDNTHLRLAGLELAKDQGMAIAHASLMESSCIHLGKVPVRILGAIADDAIKMGVKAYQAQLDAVIARPDGRTGLKDITAPTLIVVGEADTVTPPERAREMHEAIPDSRLVLLPDCSHCPPIEHPDHFNRVLDEWVTEKATRCVSA
ncbi:Pimeloyl-ACP methyl ester carboxylesterase [Cohaesibacter sp. ES.047]|uniref:alpha/beta fold hydrolase n=1 Tax=Cohaesibacter sp. ES.047 TaxID=1798205 RepID=UPI000BB70FB5|nr:alpha/beta hydrolase [Cohaesibacter sp. ES.047]SNY90713.1 Pimeloyl-ACP methyl ester carboxylesterase [Cohaesibacter sp. ES.047]